MPADGARDASPGSSSGSSDPAEVRALVARVSDLGGFFVLDTGRDDSDRADNSDRPDGDRPDGWRPLVELIGTADELLERAAVVQLERAATDARAVRSVIHLGVVARLVSPVLAAAALGDRILELPADRASWRPRVAAGGGTWFDLAVPEPAAERCTGAQEQARVLSRSVLEPVLGRLEDAVHRQGGVSRLVLRGNLVSAMAGAATVLRTMLPEAGARAAALVAASLQLPWLAGAGGLDRAGRFRRSNCCLYYRLPGGGAVCGDCVLAAR